MGGRFDRQVDWEMRKMRAATTTAARNTLEPKFQEAAENTCWMEGTHVLALALALALAFEFKVDGVLT